ncbi:MAG: glycosyltransferase family 2 protein [Candidatus Electrothrix sp. AUS4]|nr:glycosyltransferase family 2 protein [Candidatus Electrothrix sp. AUS4]
MSREQSVSLIIPTLNGEFWLGELLSGIVHQSLVPDEVIVVDSGSNDATLPLVHRYMEEHPFIRLYQIEKREFDHGGTRTMAAQRAAGDILFFMTQDAILADKMALELLIRSFAKDEKIAAAYGRQLPVREATFFSEHLRLFNYPEQSQIRSQEDWGLFGFKTVFISNSFAAWRRDVLEQQGYFPEYLLFGEDTVALAKMLEKGYYVAYVSEATVYHSHNYSILQDFKRYFDIGVLHETQARHLLQHKGPGGTGRKYILSELAFLAQKRKYYLLPEFFLRNFCKL